MLADPVAYGEKIDALARAKAELDASMALQAKLEQIPVLRADEEQALLAAAQVQASAIVAKALADAQAALDAANSQVALRLASAEAEIAANTEASNRDRNEAAEINADAKKREALLSKAELFCAELTKQAADDASAAKIAKEKAENLVMRVRLAITEE